VGRRPCAGRHREWAGCALGTALCAGLPAAAGWLEARREAGWCAAGCRGWAAGKPEDEAACGRPERGRSRNLPPQAAALVAPEASSAALIPRGCSWVSAVQRNANSGCPSRPLTQPLPPRRSHLTSSLRSSYASSSLRGMLDAARSTSASHISAQHTAGRSLLLQGPWWGT